MRSATMHARAVEDAIEGLAHIRLIERRARDRREHPVRKRSTDGEPGGALSASPQPERGGQLMRQVHASSLMILWRRQDAAYEVLLHLHEAPLPIEITPLEGEEFTGAHTSAQAAEQPWAPFGKPPPRDGNHVRGFVAGEGIDDRFGIVGAPQIPAEAERRIRRQQFILSVRAMPRTVVALSPFARHCVTSSRQSARRSEPT